MGHGNKRCLDAADDTEEDLIVYWCHGKAGTQFWEYHDGFLRRDDYCIEYDDPKLVVRRCRNKRKENRVR